MGKDTFGRGLRAAWATLLLACAALLPTLASAHGASAGAVPQGQAQVVVLAAGEQHTCGLLANGSALCWGNNDLGQAAVPAGATFTVLVAGAYHTCGLHADGSALCWGSNNHGQVMVQTGVTFTALAAGGNHSCGLRADGSALCWGWNDYGQTTVPAEATFTALVAGPFHTCGLHADGSALCWGWNNHGQTAVPAEATFTALAAGSLHTCGLRADGSARCWGWNDYGQTAVPAETTLIALAAGAFHTCGLRADGSALCWGWNDHGQTAVPAEATFTALAAGAFHTCGLRADGSVLCWGDNGRGQTTVPADARFGFGALALGADLSCQIRDSGELRCWGENGIGQSQPPAGVFSAITADHQHGCALSPEGEATCWGSNDYGQAMPAAGPFTALDAGYLHTCALRGDGTAACWGHNAVGQATVPTPADGLTYRTISAGTHQSCGVLSDNSGLCWGYADYGATDVLAGPWLSISTGYIHSCGLRVDGTLACWGSDEGAGNVTGVPTGTFKALSLSFLHACAIRSDGQLACWGQNYDGQATPPAGAFVSVATGWWHSCAIRSDGVRVCWGGGGDGAAPQLQLRPDALADGQVGAAYEQTLSLADSNGPYQPLQPAGFAVIDGSLPPGLSLAADGVLSGTPTAGGDFAFTVEGEDGNGFVASHAYTLTVIADTTLPAIVPTVSGTQGDNGWYIGDVAISWSVTDPESAISSSTGCNTVTLTTDSIGAGFTCTATSAGGTASETITVKRDATAPVIAASATTAPNAAGWYRSNVTVAFACEDALSGIVACASNQMLSTEGSAVSSTAVTVVDQAGNTSAPSNLVTVRLDKTAPMLTPAVTPNRLLLNAAAAANANGSDALSGIATQSCIPLVTASVGSKTTTCTATDAAGNSASASAGYRVVYGFTGFELPVRNGSFFNGMQNRRAIPFLWRVHDATGADVTTLASVRIVRNVIDCPSGRLAPVVPLSRYGGSDARLRNLGGGRYQRDYSVLAMHGSCAAIGIDLGDGEVHTAKFKIE